MKFPENLLRYLTTSSPKFTDEEKNRVGTLNLFTFSAITVMLISGLKFLSQESFISSAVFLGSLILMVLTLVFFPPVKKFRITAIISGLIVLLNLSFAYYYQKDIPFGFVWLFSFPVIITLMPGLKNRVLLMLLPAIIILPSAISSQLPIGNSYNPLFPLAVLFTYLLFSVILLSIIEFNRKKERETLTELEGVRKELKEKDQFISGLSHQLRTSLSNIILVNNLVNSSGLDESQKELVDTLQASTNNLVDTVNKIVDVSQSDPTILKESHISFDLRSTLETIIKIFSDNRYIDINLDISDRISHLLIGDPVKLKQIFLNVIQSILQLDSDYRQILNIHVSANRETKDDIQVIFRIDSCFVIPPQMENEKDDPCRQLEDMEVDLNQAEAMLNSVGGRFNLNKSEKKLEFEIEITYKKDPNRRIDKKIFDTEELKQEKTKLDLDQANVLLVEDNLINQKIVQLSLKEKVRNLDIANNGKEALDKFDKSKYDIILMDIQMPVMDGILATKKIREIESSTNIQTPIIAITANALSGDREKCLAVGMDDYIAKPFQVDVLLYKMKNLLQSDSR